MPIQVRSLVIRVIGAGHDDPRIKRDVGGVSLKAGDQLDTEQYKKLKRLSLAKTDEIIGGKRNNVFDLAIAINEDKI